MLMLNLKFAVEINLVLSFLRWNNFNEELICIELNPEIFFAGVASFVYPCVWVVVVHKQIIFTF